MSLIGDHNRWARALERQLARWRAARAAGMPRRGWKVGINVPEIQVRLGLGHPLVGWIDGHAVVESGACLEPNPGAKWHVEAELAIRLANAVDPALGPDAARACVADVAPALEIVDYSHPAGDLETIIEHSMFHAGCVVGVSRPVDAASELGARWPVLRVAGQQGPAPRADLVPSQLGSLVHFVAELLSLFGEGLEAGDLLLSGSYMARAVALAPHSEAQADFGPLGVVSVELR
jgi:2-keto-4-pentenoate hydratase